MKLSNGEESTTTKVWDTLVASKDGNLERLKALVEECPGLVYAQYNYTPPIHFAVREGHIELVNFLLANGALDPRYITYPFKDTLVTIAEDREHFEIVELLKEYLQNPEMHKFQGDNGEILYNKSAEMDEFQKVVDGGNMDAVQRMLQNNRDLVKEPTLFWGEGVLMMPAKDGNLGLVKLLMQYGARVPTISKWGRFYYFKHYDVAVYLMQNGMDPNHTTWHAVNLLHDMAQEADLKKAELLLQYGANINAIDDEYQSTPLGFAVRWGNYEMVDLLLSHGADPNLSGAQWSAPITWARKKNHGAIAEKLIKSGAKSN